jgi:hypothetical protein
MRQLTRVPFAIDEEGTCDFNGQLLYEAMLDYQQRKLRALEV